MSSEESVLIIVVPAWPFSLSYSSIVIILNFIITYHNFDIIECKAASDLILIGKLKLMRK